MDECICINQDVLKEWLSMKTKNKNLINKIIQECAHKEDTVEETDRFIRRCTRELLENFKNPNKGTSRCLQN